MPILPTIRQAFPVAVLGFAGLTASTALAESPARFSAAIDGFGVMRHTVSVEPDTTWAVSIASDTSSAQMFVSTEARFSPLDAVCGAERSCTIEVAEATELFVFVLAEESTRYDVLATLAEVKASR